MKHIVYLTMTCLLLTTASFAQQVSINDLMKLATMHPEQFDNQMFRRGFSCQKRHGSITDWLCIYAFQQNNYLKSTKLASALMEYITNTQSTVLVYQMQSKSQYLAMQKELLALGFTSDTDTSLEASGRRIFQKGKYIINFRKADPSNGILGNYDGYSISVMYQRVAFQSASASVSEDKVTPFNCPVRVATNL